MTNFITSMLLYPYPNQRLIQSGAVCTSCHWFQMSSYLAMIWNLLSHLTAGEYGFDIIGSPCINIYQMYVVVPMIQGSIPYIRVGLIC